MPAHGTELKTNAHVKLRPHQGGRPVTSQEKTSKVACMGLLRAAMTLGARSRSEDKQLIQANALFSLLNGVLLTAACRPRDLYPVYFGNTVYRVFQPGTSGAGGN